jgi:hypothetical protein
MKPKAENLTNSSSSIPSTPKRSKSPAKVKMLARRNIQFDKIKQALTQQKRNQRKDRRENNEAPQFEM